MTKSTRQSARQRRGTLKDKLISPTTHDRYTKAVKRHLTFVKRYHKEWPRTKPRLDTVTSEFIEMLWEEDEPLSYASDALSGLQFFMPGLRKHLPCSWRLIGAWKRAEIPDRASPFLPAFAVAVAAFAAFTPSESLAILVGFHALLRTGEILGLQWRHFEINLLQNLGILCLPSTKSGKRRNEVESVTLTDNVLLNLLHLASAHFEPGRFLVERPAGAFRALFEQAVLAAKLPAGTWKPYSIRRGGATQHFREHGSMDATALRGRWANLRTCRIYVNEANASLSHLRTTKAQDRHHRLLEKNCLDRLC